MASPTTGDYYSLLGVSRTATEKELKGAYRKLARQHHPDVNPGNKQAETRFKAIGEAYSVLSDPEKRKKYDRWGKDWEKIEQAQAAGVNVGGYAHGGTGRTRYTSTTGAPGGSVFDQADVGDLFDQLFGGNVGGRQRVRTTGGARKGSDLEDTVEITLEEASAGTQRTFQIQDAVTGEVRSVEVKIPAGAYDGLRVRVAGKGNPGMNGGPPGDIFLIMKVRPHATYERDGDDLRTRIHIPLYAAVLGGEVLVPTLKGTRLAVRVAPESSSGLKVRLAGQGLPRVHGTGRGDLYVEILVDVPKNLTPRERELFQELANMRAGATV